MIRVLVWVFRGIDWNRTSDTRIFSPLLYHLSYDASNFGGAKIARIFENAIPLLFNYGLRITNYDCIFTKHLTFGISIVI
jgi:hypothetical protein